MFIIIWNNFHRDTYSQKIVVGISFGKTILRHGPPLFFAVILGSNDNLATGKCKKKWRSEVIVIDLSYLSQ